MPQWMRACLGRPSEGLPATLDFWTRLTETVAQPRDEHEVLLEPAAGDAWLAVTDRAGAPATRFDVLAVDAGAMVSRAFDLGGAAVDDGGELTLRSPGGLPFRVESTDQGFTEPPVIEHADGSLSSANQLCIDIAPTMWDVELAFWAGMTGAGLRDTGSPEFTGLSFVDGPPYRVLLQRLDEERDTAAHLDFCCSDVAAVVDAHVAAGARAGDEYRYWTVMHDPSGYVYCLTSTHPKDVRRLR